MRRAILSGIFMGRIKCPSMAIAIRIVAEVPSKTDKVM
jgi:hypothetical protein